MIRVLPESIVRSIAAGEVIERPASVVKELLENAIDAKASVLDLALLEGGIKRITLKDNGMGMTKEDVEACLLPHATSKIYKQDDLLAISTLGFRGEALPSIAACSRIRIESSSQEGPAHCVCAENSKIIVKQETFLTQAGTLVEVEDLFFYLPARRRFLKKPHAEYNACRNVFEDVALSHANITFKLTKDRCLETVYTSGTLKERVAQVWSLHIKEEDFFYFRDSCDHVQYEFVGSKPTVSRRDRRFIKVFVNGRRVDDASLLQAILKSYEGILPGGHFPYAILQLKIEPEMVDFNIHPTKKEVRFLHLPHLVGFLIKSIRNFLHSNLKDLIPSFEEVEEDSFNFDEPIYPSKAFENNELCVSTFSAQEQRYSLASGEDAYEEISSIINSPSCDTQSKIKYQSTETTLVEQGIHNKFRYLGQFAKRYLILEFEEKLVLIDQHAAHERILFETFKKESKNSQPLLFPYPFVMEEFPLTSEQLEQYSEMGVNIHCVSENSELSLWEYELISLPSLCIHKETLVVDFIKEEVNHIVTDLFFKLYSTLACRSAIKTGEVLSNDKAEEIVGLIFDNKWFSCPHGRPLWLEFKKSYFDNLIKRR